MTDRRGGTGVLPPVGCGSGPDRLMVSVPHRSSNETAFDQHRSPGPDIIEHAHGYRRAAL